MASKKRWISTQIGCGTLPVPLDYRRPGGATVDLFVFRVHSVKQKPGARLGSLLVNAGGPGESSVDLAIYLTDLLSDDVLTRFDLIGFDQRGVGRSSPLQCITDTQKEQLISINPDVRTPAGRALARGASDAVARACTAKYGAALGHYNTEETARDMDRVRAAVGDRLLNYLGYSYGAKLGAAYAHLFPTRIRTAVLDAPTDPLADDLTIAERQTKSFEDAFDQYAAGCPRRPTCAALGNPRKMVLSLIKQANTSPLPSSDPAETRAATAGVVTTGVLAALYDEENWTQLDHALVAAGNRDAIGLFALADWLWEREAATGHFSNSLDANIVINCNDSRLRPTDSLMAAKGTEWIAKYPIFGTLEAWNLYGCHGWPEAEHPTPPPSAVGAPPILVIGTTHDPATPYAGAAVLAHALGSGVLLTWNGQGHTAYPQTTCITTRVDAYLLTTKAPASLICPAR